MKKIVIASVFAAAAMLGDSSAYALDSGAITLSSDSALPRPSQNIVSMDIPLPRPGQKTVPMDIPLPRPGQKTVPMIN